MKRTYYNTSVSAKRRRTMINNYAATPEAVNSTISVIANSYNDMKIVITRPLGTNAALNVCIKLIIFECAILCIIIFWIYAFM
jgi:hypothetical protein